MEDRKSNLLYDLAGVFLPRRCAGCDQALMRYERSICSDCVDDLPRLRSHDDPDNKVEQVFRGRLRLHAASAFLQFTKDGMVQHMLHRLKYRGDPAVGLELGRRMAEEVMHSTRFADVDVLLAVPLHRRKEKQRGYNQAQVLVDGMREAWPLRAVDTGLLRVVHTSTQTKRGRLARWGNVKAAFQLADPDALKDAHVLLVDDVVTTGATLESCALALANVPGIRISVLTCACA
ncbi:MAG: ComF family protein [Flavobacteriales bacterium]|jgi:ComF family protein|nr:ComF family protein [Flavobacteriales bacterium]MCB0757422.1 ComF family protein [Flavobacteriales bacterium]